MRDPGEADFALIINFDKNTPDPARVFKAAQDFIQVFEQIDRDLVGVIDPHIKPILMLEDVEAGSIKVWLKNVLEASDDQALKELDWRPQVGKYLVRAKYIILDICDGKTTISDVLPFRAAAQRIRDLARETDVKHLPDYREPSPQLLLKHTTMLARAKAALANEDSVSLETSEGSKGFTLDADFAPESIEEMLVAERVIWPPAPMILRVKRPDYLGNAQWEFRHGTTPISARIEDAEWLRKFQGRSPDANVRPGDALRCLVGREIAYGQDGEVMSEKFQIVKVQQVIEADLPMPMLFDGDGPADA